MKIPKGGIGFFDSGIGGLTVLSTCEKYIKNEIFYYYGDNKHAPYGNLSNAQIRRYVYAAIRKFRRLKAKAIVLGCNTATAVCVEALRKKYSVPIIGAEPSVMTAAKNGGLIFVLVTRATYESRRFQELCARTIKMYPLAQVCAFACDGLAGAIEENLTKKNFDYRQYLPRGEPDAVVLGCTHYIYIKEEIEKNYRCPTYDGNDGIAKQLVNCLHEAEKNPPKMKKSRVLRPRLTTCQKNKQKPNKSSSKNNKKQQKTEPLKMLFFLGKSRGRNKNAHEQMFV